MTTRSVCRSFAQALAHARFRRGGARSACGKITTWRKPWTRNAFVDEPAPQLSIVEPDGEPDADERAVEELGLVQLAARLGASIEKRRAWLAERQNAASPRRHRRARAFGDADDFDAAEAEDAARAIADFFGPPDAEETQESRRFRAPAPQFEPASRPTHRSERRCPRPCAGCRSNQDDEDDESALAARSRCRCGGSIVRGGG